MTGEVAMINWHDPSSPLTSPEYDKSGMKGGMIRTMPAVGAGRGSVMAGCDTMEAKHPIMAP